MANLPPIGPKENRSFHLTRLRVALAAILGFLGTILLLASCSTLITEQKISRRPTIKQQKIIRAILQITNQCPQPHRFRVISSIKDPGFKQQTDAILIGATSTKKIEVLFDASGSKSNVKARAECLDCEKAEECLQNRDELHIQMITVEPAPLKKGKVPSISTRFSSGLYRQSGPNDVGIIPETSSGCPVGSDYIIISMDDEDKKNISFVSGWTGGISRYSTGTTFGFCRVDGNRFGAHSQNDYAVLLLGSTCPPGSVRIDRVFDNEDNSPHNNWSSPADIYPNSINHNVKATGLPFPFDTKMSFCFFRADPFLGFLSPFPDDLYVPYGVFAAPSSAWFATGVVQTDDEDTKKKKTNFDSTSTSDPFAADRFAKIIFGTDTGTPLEGRNTKLLVAKVAEKTPCTTPCPYIGSYDRANCWVGQPWPGTHAFIWSTNFYYTYASGNIHCPKPGSTDDMANCFMKAIPPQTRPFIWSNMWYVEPVCRP